MVMVNRGPSASPEAPKGASISLYGNASKVIEGVLEEVRACAIDYLKGEVRLILDAANKDPAAARLLLASIAGTNLAQWSGGPINPLNILETIIREEAIRMGNYHDLHYLTFKSKEVA